MEKACDILFEHFPHVLIVTEHQDEEDKWETRSSYQGSTATIIGMAKMGETLTLESIEDCEINGDEDDDDDDKE